MKILGFNGSARKNGNSMKLLNEAVRGAQDAGAEVEIIQSLVQISDTSL